ncbi:hypothetical protein CAPTEDRAFT_222631 [Capitella teleta]|uniref:SRCR domain-containing protein n=1 Tax=Capitella teleta TaxID=283909 RepID=R7UD99_CAPTE|nr:hypothetical protein CAPTEDRAFT_222631 [Capitella teleta]|eukprot:ELU03929.1 hypothetical protein CAPTEDRAFT_222631 [Capitella teleta]
MLRFGAFLLLCALPYIDATPVSCVRRFHKLYTTGDKKISGCTAIRVLKGFHYTLDHCKTLTCKYGGNVINFKESKDDFEDNECHVLSCQNGDLKLEESHEGFNILLSDAEDKLMCNSANDRLLACWTCTDVPDEDTCSRVGHFEPCLQDNSRCGHYVETDQKGRTWNVSRGCVPQDECTDSMWGNIGECHRVDYDGDDLVSGCKHCGYGFYGLHHRCYPTHPHLKTARLHESQEGWTMVMHVNDGKEVECPLLAQEDIGYSMGACQRLAMAIGGNVVTHRQNSHCRVHKCEATGAGIADLRLRDIDHGWGIVVLAHEFPCTLLGDRILSCFTCDEKNEDDCWKKGRMQDCKKGQDVCQYEQTLDQKGQLTNVIRGCTSRSKCYESAWDPNSYAACATREDGSQTCETCLYGEPGKVHECHAAFDTKCMNKFQEVKEDKTKREMTPSCVQVANQRDHSKDSCLNLACMLHGNVAHYGRTLCEVYICEMKKNEHYVFRSRRNHRMRSFVAKE